MRGYLLQSSTTFPSTENMSSIDKTEAEHLAEALFREYLNKKGFSATLQAYDKENVLYWHPSVLTF